MECLRFGSSIPGKYWGCCAADVMQDFKVSPQTKTSIQLTSGDSGMALTNGREGVYLGPTYEDVFWGRYRIGTFSLRDMPNHAFFAIITDWQLKTEHGKAWLKILKEAGFEFIRAVSNSVGAGGTLLIGEPKQGQAVNYVFACFRNIGSGALSDPFTPPKEWTDLPEVLPEAWSYVDADKRQTLEKAQRVVHTKIWNKHGKPKFLTEKELKKAGAPVIMAGQRLPHAQPETKSERASCKTGATPHSWGIKTMEVAMAPVPPAPQKA